jgi:hypothetical protein
MDGQWQFQSKPSIKSATSSPDNGNVWAIKTVNLTSCLQWQQGCWCYNRLDWIAVSVSTTQRWQVPRTISKHTVTTMTMLVTKNYNRLTTSLYNSHCQVIAAVVVRGGNPNNNNWRNIEAVRNLGRVLLLLCIFENCELFLIYWKIMIFLKMHYPIPVY